MRHLGSLLLGLISAPLLWILTGVGVVRFNRGIHEEDFGQVALGAVLLTVAGLLVAVLLVSRISPIGPAVVGLFHLAMTAWAVLDFSSQLDLLPLFFLGTEFALTAPTGGMSAVLAVAMLATLVVPHRWASPRSATPNRPGFPPFPTPGPGGGVGGSYLPPGGPSASPGGPYGPAGPPVHPPYPGAAVPNHGPGGTPSPVGPAAHGPATPPSHPAASPYHGPSPGGASGAGRTAWGQPSLGTPGAPPSAPAFTPPAPGTPTHTHAPPSAGPAGPGSAASTAGSVGGRADETTRFAGPPGDHADETVRLVGQPGDDTDAATRSLGGA